MFLLTCKGLQQGGVGLFDYCRLVLGSVYNLWEGVFKRTARSKSKSKRIKNKKSTNKKNKKSKKSKNGDELDECDVVIKSNQLTRVWGF